MEYMEIVKYTIQGACITFAVILAFRLIRLAMRGASEDGGEL